MEKLGVIFENRTRSVAVGILVGAIWAQTTVMQQSMPKPWPIINAQTIAEAQAAKVAAEPAFAVVSAPVQKTSTP